MIYKGEKAFTMVETLVSIVIFSFISLAIVNIFVSAVNGQARILQNQTLMEQSSYALEYMGKIIRMAKKDDSGGCTGTPGTNFGLGADSLSFIAWDSVAGQYRCRMFLLQGDVIKESRSNDMSDSWASTAALTSSKVKVSNLTFALSDGATTQPRVTIVIKLESASTAAPGPTLTIQTSISQRALDI